MDQKQNKVIKKTNWEMQMSISSLIFAVMSNFTTTIPLAILSIISGIWALQKKKNLTKPYIIMAWIGIIISVIALIIAIPQLISQISKASLTS